MTFEGAVQTLQEKEPDAILISVETGDRWTIGELLDYADEWEGEEYYVDGEGLYWASYEDPDIELYRFFRFERKAVV